jgi:uncharacterized membrane protein
MQTLETFRVMLWLLLSPQHIVVTVVRWLPAVARSRWEIRSAAGVARQRSVRLKRNT